ncbi:hypothetical protein DB347_02400 [Opitutaceae bacterium EW11]|nr:hypothetical protein DB347_02400 [Opitutaceae bacterium EW11]
MSATPLVLLSRLVPAVRAPWAASVAALSLGKALLLLAPAMPLEVFARATASVAGMLAGAPVDRVPDGWQLAAVPEPVVVSVACSGTDFWLMLAMLVAWHVGRLGGAWQRLLAALGGLAASFLAAIAVNACRVVAVMQAHRWIIPRWPEAYGPFLHLLTGVAVFLPALIFCHAFLERRRTRRHTAA